MRRQQMIHNGQEVWGNTCCREPGFSKGKEKAKDKNSLPLPNMSLLPHPLSASNHTCPHSVSATGNLSTNEVDDGLGQLKPRPLEIISFNLPPCIWGKCCPERETNLAKVTQHIHYRVGPTARITRLLCGLLILHRPARVHHEHHDPCHWPAAKGFSESPSAQTSPG